MTKQTTLNDNKPKLTLYLCDPRGFCAGVVRAIDIVEKTLEAYGAPVYVRHEIVHNRTVVAGLEQKGAIFVEELNEVDDISRPVIFSAHGVPKSVPDMAKNMNLLAIDATCPLVTKVHREAMIHHKRGRHVLLIGHKGHPEVVGTLGQLPEGAISLIETLNEAKTYTPTNDKPLAYVTQTTLSVLDTKAIVDVLLERFPDIHAPKVDDICYATTNRQTAVLEIAKQVEAFLVVGSQNSSNSRRLVECAELAGCQQAFLVDDVNGINWLTFQGKTHVGLSAGASAPEELIEAIIQAFGQRFTLDIVRHRSAEETMFFPLPKLLRPSTDNAQGV